MPPEDPCIIRFLDRVDLVIIIPFVLQRPIGANYNIENGMLLVAAVLYINFERFSLRRVFVYCSRGKKHPATGESKMLPIDSCWYSLASDNFCWRILTRESCASGKIVSKKPEKSVSGHWTLLFKPYYHENYSKESVSNQNLVDDLCVV